MVIVSNANIKCHVWQDIFVKYKQYIHYFVTVNKTRWDRVKNKSQKIAENMVKAFTRFEKGEGIEKKQDDFAAEVASMVK